MVANTPSRSSEIRDFILENVEIHPKDITRVTSESFGLSRQAVLRHVRAMASEGLLDIQGTTKDRVYSLKPLRDEVFTLQVDSELKEDVIWREVIRPLLSGVNKNVVDICQYGFTEMMNNVIDHSSAQTALVAVETFGHQVRIMVKDNGVGIFAKIRDDLGLEDTRHAILELSKGKLTTDPERHTGEGVFFSSRVFDEFTISSSDLFFSHTEPEDDWLLESESSSAGTTIFMTISTNSERTLREVFDKYSVQGSFGFDRTHVPVSLSLYGDENLVSRSQARRLLARFDRFREVFLNFKGVSTIGQAFADEIFRVFRDENPETKIVYVNASSSVKRMIWRVKGIEAQS